MADWAGTKTKGDEGLTTTGQRQGWTRSPGDQWDIAGGVGYTALLVAGWRAVHTTGPHPLVIDDYAGLFVAASGDAFLTGLLADPPMSGNATAFPLLYAVQTRFFDEFFVAAAAHGIRQAVILAAGLDSRAYRLAWPPGTVVFELDRPGVLDFKARALDADHRRPSATRRAVGVDLRTDWTQPLRAAGFDAQQPTAWSAEGLLPYLTGTEQDELLSAVCDLSADGSRIALGALGSGASADRFAELEAAHPGLAVAGDTDFAALTYPAETRTPPGRWLAEHGWTVTVSTTSPELATGYGRTPAAVDVAVDGVLHSAYLVAER